MDDRFHYLPHEQRQQPLQLPPLASSTAGTVLLIYLIHVVLQYFGFPVLPPQEIFWNALVYILPTRILLDSAHRQELKANYMLSQTHVAKSDALRRMLGIGGNAVLQSLPSGDAIGLGGVGRRLSMAAGMTPKVTSDAPAGLGNWDNSCYQNSVLQALGSLRGLNDWLRTAEPPQTEGATTTNASLQELLGRLKSVDNNGGHVWTPAKLKNMSSWQQQDAQEYFSKIMDELDKEAKVAFGAVQNKPGLEVIVKRDRKGQEQESIEEEAQAIALRNPLEGLAAQQVICTSCGFTEGYSMIPFNCLTVPLGSQYVYDLEDCLDEYTKSEDIEGVECRSCTLLHAAEKLQKMLFAPPSPLKVDQTPILEQPVEGLAALLPVEAMCLPPELRTQIAQRLEAIQRALEEDDFSDKTLKQTCSIPAKAFVSSTKSREAIIGRAPQSLVVHINRSVFDEMTGMQRKNYARVQYPMMLNLRPWMLKVDDTSPQYRLSAVVQHYGRHENGHYICYKRHPGIPPLTDDEPDADFEGIDAAKERWWRLSDEDVSPVTEQEALEQSGAFMLFYERIEDSDLPSPGTEDTTAPTTVSLPPDESKEWDVVSEEPISEAIPSLVTSSAQSVISESDIDTELDGEDAAVPSAGKLPPHAPILKTASPAGLHHCQANEMNMNRPLMSA